MDLKERGSWQFLLRCGGGDGGGYRRGVGGEFDKFDKFAGGQLPRFFQFFNFFFFQKQDRNHTRIHTPHRDGYTE